MLRWLIHWLVDALIILVVAKMIPGVVLRSFGSALGVAAVLGILNLLFAGILTFLGSVITLPAILLTFGLFYFVVRFAVNTFLLWMTDKLVSGFEIKSTGSLILSSATISLLHHIAFRILS